MKVFFTFATIGLLLAAVTMAAPSQRPTAVRPRLTHFSYTYKPAWNFQYIFEYLTGQKDTRGRIIVRSQPDSRAGLYFIFHFAQPLPTDCRLQVDYIRADSAAKQSRTFILPRASDSSHILYAGLTGSDWSPEMKLTAFHLELISAEGEVLFDKKSFLWAMPEGPTPTSQQ